MKCQLVVIGLLVAVACRPLAADRTDTAPADGARPGSTDGARAASAGRTQTAPAGRADPSLPDGLGRIDAHARIPRVMGHPDAGFVELYEWDLWACESGPSEAYVRRAGAPPYRPTSHDGHCPLEMLPGRYAVLLHQPEWFVRPAVARGIDLEAGRAVDRDVMPGLDYSCATGTNIGIWDKPGVEKPWAWGRVFHQTFVARGTSITHAHYRLAGRKSKAARISIRLVTDDSHPDRWTAVGPERVDDDTGVLNDNWVAWRSGEVPTTPGQRYALCIEALPDGDDVGLGVLVHRDVIGPGYDQGTAFVDGQRQPYDLYATISSDSDGTVIPYMRVHDLKPGELAGWGTWAQTWVAKGRGLAAVDFLVAWPQDEKEVVAAELRVREGGPNGKRVGVAKRTHAAWWAPGCGFLGAVWQPGEVRLEPRKTYCIEVVAVPPSKGYSAGVVNHPANAYPDGTAFRNAKPVPDKDLEMTIVEYADLAAPPAEPPTYEPRGRNLLVNGDFEQGTASEQDAPDPPGWTRWTRRPTAFWYGRYGRNGTNAGRVIGGSINGTKIDGGFVQRVGGLSREKRYTLSGWVAASAQADLRYAEAIGYDPTGQVADPTAATIVWQHAGRLSFAYEQVVVRDVRPKGDAISVWTRGTNRDVGDRIYTVDFDDFALVEGP